MQMKQPHNQGQVKLHKVRNSSTGEERDITQAQWKDRNNDPSLDGFERVDDDGSSVDTDSTDDV